MRKFVPCATTHVSLFCFEVPSASVRILPSANDGGAGFALTSRGNAKAWLGEAVIRTLNVVFLLYLTSYLAQEDARQLFECKTPSLVHTHYLVVCRPPTTEILTENRLQRGCWVATAGDCTSIPEKRLFTGCLFLWTKKNTTHRHIVTPLDDIRGVAEKFWASHRKRRNRTMKFCLWNMRHACTCSA